MLDSRPPHEVVHPKPELPHQRVEAVEARDFAVPRQQHRIEARAGFRGVAEVLVAADHRIEDHEPERQTLDRAPGVLHVALSQPAFVEERSRAALSPLHRKRAQTSHRGELEIASFARGKVRHGLDSDHAMSSRLHPEEKATRSWNGRGNDGGQLLSPNLLRPW